MAPDLPDSASGKGPESVDLCLGSKELALLSTSFPASKSLSSKWEMVWTLILTEFSLTLYSLCLENNRASSNSTWAHPHIPRTGANVGTGVEGGFC